MVLHSSIFLQTDHTLTVMLLAYLQSGKNVKKILSAEIVIEMVYLPYYYHYIRELQSSFGTSIGAIMSCKQKKIQAKNISCYRQKYFFDKPDAVKLNHT